jgi:hypothetical protein
MIRKFIVAGLIVLGAAAAASASETTVEMNLAVGANFCRFDAKDLTSKIDVKAGFTFGVMASFYPTGFFGIQPGVLYSQKGGIYKTEVDEGTLRSTLSFSYLEVPLVAKLGYLKREDSPFHLYVLGGASYGLKLSTRLDVDLVQEGLETPFATGTIGGYKSGVFNGIAGAGADLEVKNGRLFIEGRYTWSLDTVSSEGVDHRFSVFSLLLGYSF